MGRAFLALVDCTQAPWPWAAVQGTLGDAHMALYRATSDPSEADKADEAYRSMMEVVTVKEAPREWAATQLNLGSLLTRRYQQTGEELWAEEADKAYRAALEVLTRAITPSEWAVIKHSLGNLYAIRYERTGESYWAEVAGAAYREVLEEQTQEAAQAEWAQVQTNLGSLLAKRYERTGEERWAEAAEAAFRAALELRTRKAAPVEWATTQHNLGSLFITRYERTGEERWADEAEAAFRAALEIVDLASIPVDILPPQRNLALLLARRERWVEASTAFAEAIGTLERQYLVAASDAERRRLMADHVALYNAHAYSLLRLGDSVSALARLDEGRARILGEALGLDETARLAYGADGVERLRSRRRALHIAEGDLDRAEARLRVGVPSSIEVELSTREQAASQVRAAYNALREEVQSLGLEPPILNNTDLVQMLPLGTAAVALLIGPDTYALVLYENAVRVVPLPNFNMDAVARLIGDLPASIEVWLQAYNARRAKWLTLRTAREAGGDSSVVEAEALLAERTWRATLEAIASTQGTYQLGWYFAYQFAFVLTSGEQHPAAERAAFDAWKATVNRTLAALQAWLWEPLAAAMPATVARVLLLPSGAAALLPIHAAAPPHLAVAYTPSLAVWRRCQELVPKRFANSLILATPASPHDLVSTSAPEWLTGHFSAPGYPAPLRLDQKEATIDGVLRGAIGRGVVHFSGHAFYNWDDPLRSGLLCHDNVLTLSQIRQELDLSTARLVTLSACSTGISDVFHSGEEWLGLPAGLLEMGAPAVVASLWPVNDLSTAFLMDRFYALWLEPGTERTIAEALHDAAEWLRQATWAELGARMTGGGLSMEQHVLLSELLGKMQAVGAVKMPNVVGGDFIIRMAEAEPDERPFAEPYYWAAFASYGAIFEQNRTLGPIGY
ncbi:MAG TPA: CHAT domain-containing protein [Chloroflexia bacterium]|nr:CHAT domain-containing protein [Chloroflexia bacterium]